MEGQTSVIAPTEFTQLLESWRSGDKAALDKMTPLVYDELRRLARFFLASERPDHTLQPTALVHEAYVRLVDQRSVDWKNRAHFLGVASSMMRRILINHARDRQAAKREGFANTLALEDALGVFTNPRIDLLDLNQALKEFAEGSRAAVLRRPDHRRNGGSHGNLSCDGEARMGNGALVALAADGRSGRYSRSR
jgi:RNA polymerase sigma factor (TIGR02999 family)